MIEIAKASGFCFGVKRATDALEAAIGRKDGERIYTLGTIIHNNVYNKELETRGVRMTSISEVRKLAEIVKEGRNVFKPPYNVPTYNMKKKKNQPLGSEQLLANLLEYFLIKLLREHGGDEQQEETDAPNIISEVVRYLDDNFTERITIDELAFLFKTNRATLCKEFRLATGKTVVEFINEKKLDRAKKRILSTTDTFTAIAEELNFDSIHYFTRFFKKKTGLTPKEYRRGFTLSDKQITER